MAYIGVAELRLTCSVRNVPMGQDRESDAIEVDLLPWAWPMKVVGGRESRSVDEGGQPIVVARGFVAGLIWAFAGPAGVGLSAAPPSG